MTVASGFMFPGQSSLWWPNADPRKQRTVTGAKSAFPQNPGRLPIRRPSHRVPSPGRPEGCRNIERVDDDRGGPITPDALRYRRCGVQVPVVLNRCGLSYACGARVIASAVAGGRCVVGTSLRGRRTEKVVRPGRLLTDTVPR